MMILRAIIRSLLDDDNHASKAQCSNLVPIIIRMFNGHVQVPEVAGLWDEESLMGVDTGLP